MSFAAPVPPKDASCTSCGDQKNPTQVCPLRVPAGVAFTDYYGKCHRTASIVNMLYANKVINSSYEMRQFMQGNADKVMELDRMNTMQRLAPCAPCMRPFTDNGTMTPERYVIRCSAVSCDRTEVNPSGIGDGRSY